MHGKLCVSTLVILAFGGRALAQTPARPVPPDPLPFTFAPPRPAVFEPAADPAAAPVPAAAPAPVPMVSLGSIPHTGTPTWLPTMGFGFYWHWPRKPRPPAPAKSTPQPMPRASFGGPLASPQTPSKFFP